MNIFEKIWIANFLVLWLNDWCKNETSSGAYGSTGNIFYNVFKIYNLQLVLFSYCGNGTFELVATNDYFLFCVTFFVVLIANERWNCTRTFYRTFTPYFVSFYFHFFYCTRRFSFVCFNVKDTIGFLGTFSLKKVEGYCVFYFFTPSEAHEEKNGVPSKLNTWLSILLLSFLSHTTNLFSMEFFFFFYPNSPENMLAHILGNIRSS